MNFDDYLISKKINGTAFSLAEPELFETWKKEFEQMHPNSFTVQKLNLINPIRRKYQLKEVLPHATKAGDDSPVMPAAAKPGKPVIKPKPKIN